MPLRQQIRQVVHRGQDPALHRPAQEGIHLLCLLTTTTPTTIPFPPPRPLRLLVLEPGIEQDGEGVAGTRIPFLFVDELAQQPLRLLRVLCLCWVSWRG